MLYHSLKSQPLAILLQLKRSSGSASVLLSALNSPNPVVNKYPALWFQYKPEGPPPTPSDQDLKTSHLATLHKSELQNK